MDYNWLCECCHQEKKAKTSEEGDEKLGDDVESEDSSHDGEDSDTADINSAAAGGSKT